MVVRPLYISFERRYSKKSLEMRDLALSKHMKSFALHARNQELLQIAFCFLKVAVDEQEEIKNLTILLTVRLYFYQIVRVGRGTLSDDICDCCQTIILIKH